MAVSVWLCLHYVSHSSSLYFNSSALFLNPSDSYHNEGIVNLKSSLGDCVAQILVCRDLTFDPFRHDQWPKLSDDSGHIQVPLSVCVCVCVFSSFLSSLTLWHSVFSAQMAGLLCEEEGPGADNVKYCGYCKHHYNKMVRWTTVEGVQNDVLAQNMAK